MFFEISHIIIEIARCKIGEDNLIDHSDIPKKYDVNAINQEIKGGFEKYPNSRLFDQSQYWASSTVRPKGEFKIDIILTNKIANNIKKVFWVFNSKIFLFFK